MLLQMNDIFEIVNEVKEEGSYLFTVRIDWTHDVFNGHFPEHPVVPGALLLDLIINLNDRSNENAGQSNLKNVKFLKAITPEIKEIDCMIKAGGSFQIVLEETTLVKGVI